ncbi:MAG: Ni/Fe hydrogenase subunit alpha [Longimicrobiales bacterium]|nr:Ni/Fe hydrogenase subunit alpha [Longimicrobiales bacterium]
MSEPTQDHTPSEASGTRTIRVEMLSRVEGEGRFHLRVKDGEVQEATLTIFEPPRFFEAFLVGRSLFEVPDIVPRICGICPVTYQMTCLRALEGILGILPTPEIKALRRLMYCAEWIESHALHVFLLHAPDFLGYPNAMEMAKDHRGVVEMGLRMKKAGNTLLEVMGGRAIHPVSPRVGGFSRTPDPSALQALLPELEWGLGAAQETVELTNTFKMLDFEQPYVFVALDGGRDYPTEWGDQIAISGGDPVPVEDFEKIFQERQVPQSPALHCRLPDGTPYLTGPMARLNLFPDKLNPVAQASLERSGMRLPVLNPYRSIVVRAVELVHAFAEALDLIRGYRGAEPPYLEAPLRAGEGVGATEAPRGLQYQRYRVDEKGMILEARIVPPTSQNQARIEADLAGLAPEILAMTEGEATLRCEQLIRAYDPCISCATHFLKLEIERE